MFIRKIKCKKTSTNEFENVSISYCFENLFETSCFMKFSIEGVPYSSRAKSFFLCLLELRQHLETQNIELLCNGSAQNVSSGVHPIMDEHGNVLIYKIQLGRGTSGNDLINMFDYDETLEMVSVKKQQDYGLNWIDSLEEKTVYVGLSSEHGDIKNNKLIIYYESPYNNGLVTLIMHLETREEPIVCSSDNYFDCLIRIRSILEIDGMQILINGAAENVNQSPMQKGAGGVSKAYQLTLGKSALNSDLVDIFDYNPDLNFTTIDKQEAFNTEWHKSISQSNKSLS